ncbi:MAG: CBS domain-containing protein [Gammaproteobacteria bacterium]|nr:CBS domain-containing protein [Gammaproteobacteria bacterium]
MKKNPDRPPPATGNSFLSSLRTRFSRLFRQRPRERGDLVEMVRDAEGEHVIDLDTAGMMEGALMVSELKVRDIMVPRSEMVFIESEQTPKEFLPAVIESAHSRFPVVDMKHEKVLGILLAKDLLPLAADPGHPFEIREVLRPAVFVPESKRLNILLREFRLSRNHLAIVVDEYGAIAGLVSIEDVLEQIVGEIDDEYDVDDELFIRQHRANRFTVKARTPIEHFNEFFDSRLPDGDYDTIGGLVVHHFGRVPERGDEVDFAGFNFKVLRADRRRAHLLRVMRQTATDSTPVDDDG